MLKRVFHRKLLPSIGLCLGLLPLHQAIASEGAPREASTIAAAGFGQKVKNAEAVIIRVPVNAKGEVNTGAAEMRLYSGEPVSDPAEIADAWTQSEDVSHVPQIDKDKVKEASTWGFFRYRWGGWANPYCYFNYQPYFWGPGYGYGFGSPLYYNSYGYNYYYYSAFGYNNYYW